VTKLCATQNIAAVATEVWHAVKYPWHLLGVLELLLEEIDRPVIHPSAKIHPSAVIEGNVIIGPEARVLHHATVIGPSVIGAHAVIGTGALVRGSSIADHCVIGYATEVKSSVLCPHVWTHSTYIGDSVIGENVAFGSGSVIANFRLDEQDIYSTVKNDRISTQRTKMGAVIGANSRLGIRTSLHPGVKVGAGSFVNGGVMLDRDVPDGSFVTNGPEGILVRKNRTSAPKAPARNQYRNTIV
jgi:bifunctional UDP-N-acetylglucosamine pyrophosphorylase/glucosamine-1-phosphate N-acetyltransferase